MIARRRGTAVHPPSRPPLPGGGREGVASGGRSVDGSPGALVPGVIGPEVAIAEVDQAMDRLSGDGACSKFEAPITGC